MQVHLINPSDISFGAGVITPRWLYVLAGATPRCYGDPWITDETLQPAQPEKMAPGDVVGIGITTSNASRGYELGRLVRERGCLPVFGGIHATLYPEESHTHGGAVAVVRGDGDLVWSEVLSDCAAGRPRRIYEGGSIAAADFAFPRWDLLSRGSYMWGSVQTVRGCPKRCSFCSVWRTDGQVPRQRPVSPVVEEVVMLRRRGYRFIALADDNFYPVTQRDLALAAGRSNKSQYDRLLSIRSERFELMKQLARISKDVIFFTQITMEAAEDEAFLNAMKAARIKGALIGVESVSVTGLKSLYKGFNLSGDDLIASLQRFNQSGIHVLGSFIFGLQSDTPATFTATSELADRAGLTFAQFIPLTPFPGTIDFEKWAKGNETSSRYWLLPPNKRPRVYLPHPTMSEEEIKHHTKQAWASFYGIRKIWRRSRCTSKLRSRLAFILISKLYSQMYAKTGMTTGGFRRALAVGWARIIARPCVALFSGRPLPDLQIPLRTAPKQAGSTAGEAEVVYNKVPAS
ncbi:MAG: radical SAM protein [Acidobacteria bacterium]|nr:radical SAM protein [Acidobacteriota bacterium]